MEELKICTICGVSRPTKKFSKRKASPDGLQPKCKMCASAKDSAHYLKNREKILASVKIYSKINRDKITAYGLEYVKARCQDDPAYKMSRRLRKRLWDALNSQGAKKNSSAIKDLGCTIGEFKNYLESKFTPGMSWDNYGRGGWVLDHIRPLSSFNLSLPEQQMEASRYTNLQPLWEEDNLKKGDSWTSNLATDVLT
jgi:hypothetical protein